MTDLVDLTLLAVFTLQHLDFVFSVGLDARLLTAAGLGLLEPPIQNLGRTADLRRMLPHGRLQHNPGPYRGAVCWASGLIYS